MIDYNILNDLYINQKKTIKEVGDFLGLGFGKVRKDLIKQNIQIRKPGQWKIKEEIILSDEQHDFF